jgi:hypothetical protein
MPRISENARQALAVLEGQPVTELIVQLNNILPEISEVTFVAYHPAPSLNERLARNTDPTNDIRTIAESLWRDYGIPFWDAVLAVGMKRGEIPDRFVDLAILHDNSPQEHSIQVPRNEVSVARIDQILDTLNENLALAFSSKVRLKNGEIGHIPLMDFRCSMSPQNTLIVKRALGAMGQHEGVLVDSGRSYHFYGLRILPVESWIHFLAMSILFSPVVDVRYVAHRLADGACRLRVAAGQGKRSNPRVREVFT